MRKFALFAFSFAAAAAAEAYISSPKITAGLMLVCLAVLIISAVVKWKGKPRSILICAGIIAGLVYCEAFNYLIIQPLRVYDDEKVTVTAEVCDFPKERDYGVSVDVKLSTDGIFSPKMRIYVYNGSADGLEPGDKIELTAELSVSNIIGDDTSDYFFSQGIYLMGRRVTALTVTEKNTSKLLYFHKYLCKYVTDKINEIFPESAKALALAILIGDKTLLNEDYETTVDLQRSGIYHIATVSGMHISMLTAFVLALTGKKRGSLVVLLPVLFIFMGMTGFTPSVVRAVVIQLFVVLAPLFKREDDRITSLSSALLLLILKNPFVITSVGLQLSFLATLGIILFSPGIGEFIKKAFGFNSKMSKGRKRLIVSISSSASVTIGAVILTMPLSAIYFGYISLSAPVTNIFIGWLATPAFVLSLIAVFLGFVYTPLGIGAAYAASVFLRLIIWGAGVFAKSFFSALYVNNIFLVIWIVFVYCFIGAFIFFKKKPGFLILPSCAAISSLCIILIVMSLAADRTEGYCVEVLDVGQGQSIVVYNSEYTVVIDCGSSSGEDAGQIAASYIYSLGRNSIDALILTHFHADHANGVEKLMASVDVESVVLPSDCDDDSYYDEKIIALAEKNNSVIIYVEKDVTMTVGSMELTLYAPLGSATENERGVCILITENEFDTLVTGDIGSEQEILLITLKALPDIECLIVGHHGSKYSTCTEFLEAVKPEIGIISVGKNNTYGHPTEEALERLQEAEVQVFRTDEDGSILVSSTGGSYGGWIQQ